MNRSGPRVVALAAGAVVAFVSSHGFPPASRGVAAQQSAPETVKSLETAPDLEVTLWASESAFSNPTNMAIDERGRVWVTEAVNYRRLLRSQPDIRPEGDRIVILEDTDGDGKADRSKVFDQDPNIRAPLGIAVLGDKVIVSQAPDMTVYTKDADDRIVKKEVLLTGWMGVDHDHGLHAVVFGFDGRYYFNAGNEPFDVTDRSGRRLQSARPGGGKDPQFGPGRFFEGVVLSVNPDGSGLQILAQNFRNNYELALDSFGNIWQTDNDDDGNSSTRANYVMEGGNYGFRGPHGRTWKEDGGSHWHSELPGVVPNLLALGPGSPCGLIVYEGTLLPERYRGNLLHAEAGRRVIAHYPLTASGAGFSSRIDPVVYGGEDTWFRPSDLAVAPDGAVYIADWYDPAVGGHNMGDPDGKQGRIYRLAPRNYKPSRPTWDLDTPQGLAAAFGSPAQSVYYLAHQKLRSQGAGAVPWLQSIAKRNDPVLRARALWMLGASGSDGLRTVRETLRDPDPRFRVLALRILQRTGADMLAVVQPLLRDPSPQVRREIALLLRDPEKMTPPYLVGEQTVSQTTLLAALVELAKQHDGKDRWYLAAVGIAARGREDAVYAELRNASPRWTPALGDLLWELRAPASLPYLIEMMNSATLSLEDRMRALDTVAVMQAPEAMAALETLVMSGEAPAAMQQRAFAHYRRQLFSLWADARKSARLSPVLKRAFATPALQAKAVELAGALGDPAYTPDLVALATADAVAAETRAAALEAAAAMREAKYHEDVERLAATGPIIVRAAAVRAMGLLQPPDLEQRARTIFVSDAPNDVRAEALRIMTRTADGMRMLVDLEQAGKFPAEMRALASTLVSGRGVPAGMPEAAAAAFTEARARAAAAFPRKTLKIPSSREMEQNFRPDVASGKQVFEMAGVRCYACHSATGEKKMGPDLSAIGVKFGKQALLDTILMPSAGIAFGYEAWLLETKTGEVVTGLIVEDTPERITIQVDEKQQVRLKPSDVVSRTQSRFSIMPEGLLESLSQQQIVDLLEFLTTLKGRPSAGTQ